MYFSFLLVDLYDNSSEGGGRCVEPYCVLSKSKGTVYVLLGMVSERTDFLFIYDSKVVDNERLVKIEKGSRTLRQAITEIVGIQDLELRVVGNHILINAPVKREYPMEQVVDTLAHFVLEGTLLDKRMGCLLSMLR